jgi:two-component system, OmpR family, phosphate regulon sensor histidine kinase PhoR
MFRKLLLSALALIAITLGVLDFYLTSLAGQQQVQVVEERLEAQARILAAQVPQVERGRLEAWAKSAEPIARARITLIGPDGIVLADSQHDPESMENHNGRPEVVEARRTGRRGTTIRHSATLDRDLCYVAIPAPSAAQPGAVLRLALPLKELDSAVAAVRWRMFEASAVAAALALLMAYFFSRSFTRRVQRIQRFAESLLGARAPERLAPDSSDELGMLASTLSRASLQLKDVVEKLSVESARREAILASMVEGVLAVDAGLHVTFCNASFARAVGAQLPIPDNLPLIELVRDPAFIRMLSQVLVTGQRISQRLQLSGAEGRSYEVQAAPLGSRRGAIAILHDVTELERLERVRRDFVANVSHELRTPLTAIRGYAETLLDGALEDEEHNRKFVEVIRSHAIRLNNISSDLLVLSELESGQHSVDPQPVPILDAIESALRTVESEARVREVRIVRGELDDAEVMGHRIRIEQALVNLLDNAVKFNRAGGEVTIATELTPDGKVRITVADNGIGIPSDDLPRIFERFYRVDKARSRDVGGTGLGLSIVKHVLERMNGTISADSQLGKGSRFTITLPVL